MKWFRKVVSIIFIIGVLLFFSSKESFASENGAEGYSIDNIALHRDRIVEEKNTLVYPARTKISKGQDPTFISTTAWIDKAYPLSNNEKVRWYVKYVNGKKYEGWLNYTGNYRNLRVVANVLYKAEFEFKGTLYPA